MQTRTLGADGPPASTIGFGAWAIGGWKWGGTDEAEAVASIRRALDTGMTLIDTAPVYGFGLSETLVGRAIATRPRDSVVVATKCGLRWDRESPTLHATSEGRRIHRTLDRDSMREEIRASLGRLGLDHVDLYQTHWPDPEADMQEVAETLAEFKREGLARAVGFCNSDPGDLQAAKARRLLEGPLVEVDCATLRGDTARSALFNHRRGGGTPGPTPWTGPRPGPTGT